jgi:hypothetical protein
MDWGSAKPFSVIVERELNDPTLRYGVLDPACFKEDGGPSIAERINKELTAARLPPFHAADNSRVPLRGSMGGWDQLRSRLVGQDGQPMIFCFGTHVANIRTIPALQHDPARPENVNTESEDHAADEWRACLGRLCGCPWHALACQSWDMPHSALPRRMIGSSSDARGRLRRNPRESAAPGAWMPACIASIARLYCVYKVTFRGGSFNDKRSGTAPAHEPAPLRSTGARFNRA